MDLVVETVDGELLDVNKARGLAKKGFACLPWLWGVNVWMFWPDFKHGDPVVQAYARRSAYCFAGWACLFLPWMLAFMIAGPSVVGRAVFDKLDAYQIDLAGLSIGF